MRFLVLLALPCFGQTKWVSIANQPYQFFRYGAGKSVEMSHFDAQNPHPPRQYDFETAPAPARKVCALEDRPGVYWFTPDGRKLAGTFATSNPTEFNVSALQRDIRGFAVKAAFQGSAQRVGAVEVVYFTDRVCSDGGTEFGFTRDLATNDILVYWSTFANCGNDAASVCRKTDSATPGKNFSNVQQENGGTHPAHGYRIYGLDVNAEYTYRMFVEHRKLRVEVWNGSQPAGCSRTPGGRAAACAFTDAVEPWFPIDRINAGYIVAGTQTAGDPGKLDSITFAVSDILVAQGAAK